MDRGAWQATVHGVAKSRIRLSNFTFSLSFLSFSPSGCRMLQGLSHPHKQTYKGIATWEGQAVAR